MIFTEVLLGVLPWGAVIFLYLLHTRICRRLIEQNEELTQQILAFKNPWAAQLYTAGKEATDNNPNADQPQLWDEADLR